MSYSLDHNFFDVIDTEQKAYFLGLLYADGCVQATGGSWRLRLGLHIKDQDSVAGLKEALAYDGPLHMTKTRASLAVSSKRLGDTLIGHGCIPRKSLTLEYPSTVPENLSWHFIRGYFDGDGCLCISGRGARWTLVGTEKFLTNASNFLSAIGVNCSIYPKKRVYILSVSGNKQISVLLDSLYRDATFFMSRKYGKKIEFNNLMADIRPIRKRDRVTNRQEVVDDYQAGMKVRIIEFKHQITNRTMYKILQQNNVEKRQVSHSAS